MIWPNKNPVSFFVFNSLKVWNFEAIDTADSVDETGLLEMEPMNELRVGRNVSLSFMSKIHDCGQPFWYAQVRYTQSTYSLVEKLNERGNVNEQQYNLTGWCISFL